MSMKIHKYLLPLIIVVAFFIRFVDLSNTPALNPDEAALGYNAYSLILTGKDEHGASWPIHFKSFGDYKPGGYVYLAIPFVKFFGLNPLSVRFPNLILSVLTILFLYKLILLLSKSKNLALLSSTVLCFSPWHIHFSRGAWESCTALAFITMGTYFFFKSINSIKFIKNFSFFVFFYILSIYCYHSARIVAPLLALSLCLLYFKTLIKKIPQIIFPLIFGIILALPVAISFLNNGGTARFGGVGLTADQGPIWRSNELINQHQNNTPLFKVVHNKRILYLISWAEKYSSHFNLNFLTINGDEVPRSKVPEMGQIYIIDAIFLILGIIFCLKTKIISHKNKIFLFLFLFIAPLASSLTFQAQSALRSLPMTIPLSIFISFGIYFSLSTISKFKKSFSLILFLAYLFSVSYYLDAYFVHYAKRYPFAWQYGFDQLVPYLENQKDKYQNIYITNKYDQPYVLFLFYSKYPPENIQKQIQLTEPDNFGFSTVLGYDKYHFGKINWESIPNNSLVIASDETVPISPIKTIDFPNQSPAFKIYQKQ